MWILLIIMLVRYKTRNCWKLSAKKCVLLWWFGLILVDLNEGGLYLKRLYLPCWQERTREKRRLKFFNGIINVTFVGAWSTVALPICSVRFLQWRLLIQILQIRLLDSAIVTFDLTFDSEKHIEDESLPFCRTPSRARRTMLRRPSSVKPGFGKNKPRTKAEREREKPFHSEPWVKHSSRLWPVALYKHAHLQNMRVWKTTLASRTHSKKNEQMASNIPNFEKEWANRLEDSQPWLH